MKYSSIMHSVMIVSGALGFVALVGGWLASNTGVFLGLPVGLLYTNALNLQVVAVSAGICTLVRRQMEKEGSGSIV